MAAYLTNGLIGSLVVSRVTGRRASTTRCASDSFLEKNRQIWGEVEVTTGGGGGGGAASDGA